MARVVFLTNFIPPYLKPVLDTLTRRHGQLRVLVSTPMETNRPWRRDWGGLDVVVQKTVTITGKWRHPRGFSEPTEVHFPYDTVAQLRKYSPAVVISTEMGFRTMAAILYTKLHRQAKVIVWTEVNESTEHGRGTARKLIRKCIGKQAHGFLALGTHGVHYVENLGVDHKRIFKLLYATDVRRFDAARPERSNAAAKRLLYVGQLIERKGLTQLMAALRRWAENHSEERLELLIAGDGPLRPTIHAMNLPRNFCCSFLGSVSYEELPGVYGRAGIFAFPTLADTWGLVVNEAMAAGLPVLGSTYSQAVQEMVTDGVSGWTFRPDDRDELYGKIERAMSSSTAALNQMRRCARVRALELTPEHVADLIDAAIRACMERSVEETKEGAAAPSV
jgi:glycosyltransferase involved in cell wall biosynthesis